MAAVLAGGEARGVGSCAGEYPDIVRWVATAEKIPLIDMHRRSEAVLKAYGLDSSRTLFLQLKAGENPNYPKGIEDNTHFSPKGAAIMAGLATDGLAELKIGLSRLLLPRSCPHQESLAGPCRSP